MGMGKHTSYHLGPSAQILINFSLNSRVCLSIPLRSNFEASTVTSDFGYMIVTYHSFLCPCSLPNRLPRYSNVTKRLLKKQYLEKCRVRKRNSKMSQAERDV